MKRGKNYFLRNINMFCRWYTMFNQQESNNTRHFTIYGKIRKGEESGKIDRFETEEYSNRYCGLVLVYIVI